MPSIERISIEGQDHTSFVSRPRPPRRARVHVWAQEGWEPGKAMPPQPPPRLIVTTESVHSREASQGFAVAVIDESIFVPLALIHQDEQAIQAYYGPSSFYPAQQPVIVHIDPSETTLRVPNQAFASTHKRSNWAGGQRPDACLLPRAAAADKTNNSVLISCYGTNEIRAFDAAGGALNKTLRGRWSVPAGPSGIAVDEKRGVALVWSQYEQSVSEIGLPTAEDNAAAKKKPGFTHAWVTGPAKAVPAPRVERFDTIDKTGLSAKALRGREIFHGVGDRRISADGRACASCHPDGRDDGIVWRTPAGKRQTPMLAGRVDDGTGPYGWAGHSKTLPEYVGKTFTRLGGTGVKGADLEALIAYLHEAPTPHRADDAKDVALVTRGKELFHAETVGCATCHKNGADTDGVKHEVGSGRNLDTPSLRFIAGTSPYFHDGRFATLGELLRKTKGKMGWNGDMSDQDLDAIEAYLTTL